MQFNLIAQQSPLSKKNEKIFKRSKKSKEGKENASGDESVYKTYNVKSPKNAFKENKDKVIVTPERVKKTSKEASSSNGDINKAEKFGVNSPSYIKPAPNGGKTINPKEVRKSKTSELNKNSSGDVNAYDVVGANSNTSLSPAPRGSKYLDAREVRKQKAEELKKFSSGDINVLEKFGVNSNTYLKYVVEPDEPRDLKAIRHAKAGEIRQNASGDFDVIKKSKKNLSEGLKMFEMKNEYPDIRKRNSREAASSGGDVEEIYQIRQYIEEYMSRLQSQEQGLVDADVLKKTKKHREQYDKEMGSNMGDVNGTAKDKLNKEKAKSAIIASYNGNINIDLKERNKKTKQLSHELAINNGDILLKSIKSMENNNRAKTKRATSFRGDMLVTAMHKGSHPSAVYHGGNKANSLDGKEKLRKRFLRKSRRNKGIEDPTYMNKPVPQPKFNEEEYKIWEVRGRGVAPN